MVSKKSKNETRQKRHLRIRKNIIGSATCPRLVVFKSNTNIYAQVIDDEKVKLKMGGSLLAMKIVPCEGEKYTYLVLPVRLPRE